MPQWTHSLSLRSRLDWLHHDAVEQSLPDELDKPGPGCISDSLGENRSDYWNRTLAKLHRVVDWSVDDFAIQSAVCHRILETRIRNFGNKEPLGLGSTEPQWHCF